MKKMKKILLCLFLITFASTSASIAQDSVTYEYDELGRVTKVTYSDGSYTDYSYDPAGNRLTQTGTGSGSVNGDGGNLIVLSIGGIFVVIPASGGIIGG